MNKKAIIYGLILIIVIISCYLFINNPTKPKYEKYIDWDEWKKALYECDNDLRDYMNNTPITCNPTIMITNILNECELHKLEYNSIYWKKIYCEDNTKLKDYEKIRWLEDE